jgi:hypothetical protein
MLTAKPGAFAACAPSRAVWPVHRPRRAGRWPSLCGVRWSGWHRPARAGESRCLSCPRPKTGETGSAPSLPPAAMAKAMAFATSERCPSPAGGQSPRSAPAPPLGRALRPRRVGRWPSLCGVCRSLPHRSAGAGEARCVSLAPPGDGANGSPEPAPRHNGKGHRLCHSVSVKPARRGPKPPASARPALRPGASRPPGRALAFVARAARVFATASRRGGGNAVRTCVPRHRGRFRPGHPEASPRDDPLRNSRNAGGSRGRSGRTAAQAVFGTAPVAGKAPG